MYSITVFVTALLVAQAILVHARPMHAGIDYQRYLQEKDDISKELDAWLVEFGEIGRRNGWIPPTESRSAVEVAEDRKQRFFLTKQLLPQLEREQPDAKFSTNTPFTLLTEAEFATYVRNSYLGSGNDGALGTVRAANLSDDDSADDDSSRLTTNLNFTSLESRRLQVQTLQSKDWSTSPCSAPVQDQGACGSCWAFATVGAVETARCLATQSFTKFSEQQLTSCDGTNFACEGGVPVYAFQYIKQNGLCPSIQYAYTSAAGRAPQCNASCKKTAIPIKQIARITSTEASLVNTINRQPLVVAVTSGNAVWKQYSGGVVSSCPAGSKLDHAVIAVGYDSTSIKIKNSWGARWGENGYIRLQRGTAGKGTCGVLTDMSYPAM